MGPSKCGERNGHDCIMFLLRETRRCARARDLRSTSGRTAFGGGLLAGGEGLLRVVLEAERESQGTSAGVWRLWRACEPWGRRPAPNPRGQGAARGTQRPSVVASAASQPVFPDSPLEQKETDRNLSIPLCLQLHLPPDLSKQGKELQTWQSPSLAEADSCQAAAGARAPPSSGWGAQGEEGRGCNSPSCLTCTHTEGLPVLGLRGCPPSQARVPTSGPST